MPGTTEYPFARSAHCLTDKQRVRELLEGHDLSVLQLPNVGHSSLHFPSSGAESAVVGPHPDHLVAAVDEVLQFEAVADPIPAQNGKDVIDNRLRPEARIFRLY